MTEPGVTVTITYIAKPGMEERLEQVLTGKILPSRGEDGCLNYFMHRSLDRPGEFMLYMNWRAEAAYDRHVASPWVQEFHTREAEVLLQEPMLVKRWRHLG
jgi:quinol monooxygenase YgiN